MSNDGNRLNPYLHLGPAIISDTDLTVYERMVYLYLVQPLWWDNLTTKQPVSGHVPSSGVTPGLPPER
jgi:hypothetical protein